MIGDLILYRSTGRWYERLITFATHGPWVHVAIVIDADTVIASRSNGIGYEAAPPEDALHTVVSLAGRVATAGVEGFMIEHGLAWADRQVGKKYGWLDIVYQSVKFAWPHQPFRFSEAGHYDCSEFVTRYMLQAGVELPPAFDDPATITPNDLARWAGLLPPRKGRR